MLKGDAMKKILIAFTFALLLVSAAMADQVQVGYPGSRYGAYQTGVGGEFTLTPVNPTNWLDLTHYGAGAMNVGVAGSFQTFCLEGGEYIYPNSIYNAVIQQNVVNGGVGPGGDPISKGTGWLYSQFASGNWESGLSYAYGAGRGTDADLFQKAIWWLEGEEGITYTASNRFMSAVVNHFGSELAAQADGGSRFGVYALHLTTENGGPIQDQLYFSGIPVPDSGATIALLGLAVAGLGFVSRRFRI